MRDISVTIRDFPVERLTVGEGRCYDGAEVQIPTLGAMLY